MHGGRQIIDAAPVERMQRDPRRTMRGIDLATSVAAPRRCGRLANARRRAFNSCSPAVRPRTHRVQTRTYWVLRRGQRTHPHQFSSHLCDAGLSGARAYSWPVGACYLHVRRTPAGAVLWPTGVQITYSFVSEFYLEEFRHAHN